MGSDNVFVTNDGGSSCMWKSKNGPRTYLILVGSAVPGQNNTFIPHKGVFSVAEKSLYVSYANGAGPYDGTAGYIQKVCIVPMHPFSY